MSFADYDELKATVKSWSLRGDLDTDIPDFITLAEARLGRKLALLDWNAESDLVVTDNRAPLPADYKQVRAVLHDNKPLTYVTPAELAEEVNPNVSASRPVLYTLIGDEIVLGPSSSTTEITLQYVARLVHLSASVPTNWLLENHPDLLLFGAMEALCSKIRNADAEAKWAGKFSGGIEELDVENAFSSAGSPLEIRSV